MQIKYALHFKTVCSSMMFLDVFIYYNYNYAI
jgi:hypothetical protein